MTTKTPDTRQRLELSTGVSRTYHSLPQLEERGAGNISRLPVSLRVLLESALRNADGERITGDDVEALARWQPNATRTAEVPFVVGRVLLQDFTGVPLLVDLAAMRSAAARRGYDAAQIQPTVDVDLVIDHSVQVDYFGRADAFDLNMEMEFRRNNERYRFLKWGMGAFEGLRIVPPGFGICHQVNLEFLARAVLDRDGVLYPDSLVGTDSHTPMINGLGVVGWGVGGIEAEAAMLGEPVYLLLPDVVGVHLHGRLLDGVTATDLVLHITQVLRRAGVVGKLVEFHGDGAAGLSVPDRATIGNMSPEYGATIGFFPVDEETCRYLRATGRDEEHVETVRRYYKAQGMFGMPESGQCDYSTVIDIDLASVEPSVAGPKRPQDRIALGQLKQQFLALLASDDGFGKSDSDIARHVGVRLGQGGNPRPGGGSQSHATFVGGAETDTSTLTESEMLDNRPTPNACGPRPYPSPAATHELTHGDVVIAAITSCTNTSNPAVMLAAGLLAKKASERGLAVKPWVKTSLAPGSRVVSEYLLQTGLQPFFDELGFNVVGFGCTTCIGNSGPLDAALEEALIGNDLIGASVLSGNRNFEARIHQSVKANFLMSPPLVVAFALAGRVDIDLTTEPIGVVDGEEVYLRDVWPSTAEIDELLASAFDPDQYLGVYSGFAEQNPIWNEIPTVGGHLYEWDPESLYIREPPYFDPSLVVPGSADIRGARGDVVIGDEPQTGVGVGGNRHRDRESGELDGRGGIDGDRGTQRHRSSHHGLGSDDASACVTSPVPDGSKLQPARAQAAASASHVFTWSILPHRAAGRGRFQCGPARSYGMSLASNAARIETDCVATTAISHAPLMPASNDGFFFRTMVAAKNEYITTNHSTTPAIHNPHATRRSPAITNNGTPSTHVPATTVK